MIGQMVAHYKILEKLGEGGMGVVYKAHDTRLDRTVALKFLTGHVTANEEAKARFLQEARAAAALNQNNICTIYGVDQIDGNMFIAMEYIEGGTLREKLPYARVEDAITVAIQIGEALQEAHAKGIVHRDIKADNVMMTSRGQVKVMDFGLAKLKGSLKLTKTSSTIGTLGYMAPEQIQGSDVDNRSDIFSFGVLLFEMLTGKLPFRGDHEAAMVYSIVNSEPESIQKYRPEVSPELVRIIEKALEKDPAERFQSVADMVVDMRRVKRQTGRVVLPQPASFVADRPPEAVKLSRTKSWILIAEAIILIAIAGVIVYRIFGSSSGSPSPERRMLVVLPFENLGSPDQEYFADGITEEITSKLSGLSGLGVIARSSAMQYKKTTKTLKQIGQELGVSYVLQGTIRWENVAGVTHVRVNPQLITISDGTQIWSQPSEAVLTGAFKLQSEVASQVASALNITLLTQERQSLEAKLTENPEAYDLYLRGNEYFFRSSSEQDNRIALQMYQRAVDLDPKFAVAYARLSEAHANMFWEFYDRSKETLERAQMAAETALRLDPSLAEAHGAMAWYYYHGLRDYDKALEEFARALQAAPNEADLLLGIGSVYRRQGKFDEALVRIRRAADLDPRSAQINNEVGTTFEYLRRYAEAIQWFDRAIEIAPDAVVSYWDKANALIIWKGDVEGARDALAQVRNQKIGADESLIKHLSVQVEICGGAWARAREVLESYSGVAFPNQFWYVPKDLLRAVIDGYEGRPALARRHFEEAKSYLENELRNHPDDARMHSSLGIAYAGLGLKPDAVREGKRAIELMPLSQDAMIVPLRMVDLAEIFVMIGDQEHALGLIEQLLAMPSSLSVQVLRLDPVWASLRGNPRFQKLVGGMK